MVIQNGLGLNLYVATQNYGNRQQYEDSQVALIALDILGLTGRIGITHLDKLDLSRSHLSLIIGPDKELRLPVLECIYYHRHVGDIIEYPGLEEITDALADLASNGIIEIAR